MLLLLFAVVVAVVDVVVVIVVVAVVAVVVAVARCCFSNFFGRLIVVFFPFLRLLLLFQQRFQPYFLTLLRLIAVVFPTAILAMLFFLFNFVAVDRCCFSSDRKSLNLFYFCCGVSLLHF